MKRQLRLKWLLNGSAIFLAALLFVAPMAGTASAQNDGTVLAQNDGAAENRNREEAKNTTQDNTAAGARNREEAQNSAQDPQGEVLRQRIRDRIENEAGLQTQERDQLRKHLGECEKLGLDDAVLGAIFDESEPLQKQIRTQERVLAMAREGLPVDPVAQKLQEGRRKGVNEAALEKACVRMEENIRAANRYMEKVREAGVTPGDRDAERRRTAEMARHMWNGLTEGDMNQLQECARFRLRDGSCTTDDVAVAGETAVKLGSLGIERERAARVAGEALQYGYTAKEMRQFSWMVMTARMHGGPQGEVLDTIERGIRNQHQLAEMVREMYQRGWMGPGDEHGGQGGHHPADDSGGHHHGGDDPGGHGDPDGHKGPGGQRDQNGKGDTGSGGKGNG